MVTARWEGLQFVLDVGDNITVEEVDDALGVAGVLDGVGYHEDGGAFAVELGEEFHYLFAVLGVEVTGGLVGEDELGVGDDGAGDGYPLLLTSGELLGEVGGAVGDVHALEDVVDHLLALRGLDLHVDEGQLHVLEDVQFVYEVEALEYEADVAFAVLGALFLFQRAYFLAEELVLARGGVVEEAEDVEEGGFAAAGGAHNGYELTLLDVEGDVVEGYGFDFFGAEYFA